MLTVTPRAPRDYRDEGERSHRFVLLKERSLSVILLKESSFLYSDYHDEGERTYRLSC